MVLHVASRRITATVAWSRPDQGEQVVAHRALEYRWAELTENARANAITEALRLASKTAGVEIYSAYVCMSDPTLRANFANGFADLGQPMTLGKEERDLALARATHQPIGTNRRVLHALPQHWSVRDESGEREVENPVGHRGMRLACNVLLVTAERHSYDYLEQVLHKAGITMEGMLAPPVALYRGLTGTLPKRGSTVVIDCGARHTSFVVHRKGRLIHLETHDFGGDDLTEAIAEELKISLQRAEATKAELDIGSGSTSSGRDEVGQTYLWRDVQETNRHLAPAALVCATELRRFFKERFKSLRDMELLSQTGRVHLLGRAAALGGLPSLVREVFGMEVVLGTRSANRDPGTELADVITVGLIRSAAEERARMLAERQSSGIRQVASAAGGFWSWLTAPLQ